ncbi:MAG: MYXO-CTERM sorting domain-containing protein, partial [Myxococcota bacterium]
MSAATASALALATTIFAASATAQVTLPFVEDFEGTDGETYTATTASLAGAPNWSFEPSTAQGRLRMRAGSGFTNGNGAATLDAIIAGAFPDPVNSLILTLDMSNYDATADGVSVAFDYMDHGDEGDPNDGVWVRGSDSDPWVLLLDLQTFSGSSGTFVRYECLSLSNALAGAGQQFSNTFQLRFSQEDNFPATAPTGSDGSTFDDIRIFEPADNDLAVTALLSPMDQACGESMHSVQVEVSNGCGLPQSNIPVEVVVSGDVTATFTGVIPGPIATLSSETISLGSIDTFDGGDITMTATVSNPGDTQAANDQLVVEHQLLRTRVPVAPLAPVCPGGVASIAPVAEPATDYTLWDAVTEGNAISQGATLTSPALTDPATFYIERTAPRETNGAVDNSIGAGGDHAVLTEGLVFDVLEPVVLDAVSVYPSEEGEVRLRVFNQNTGFFELGSSVTITANEVGAKTRIPVGLSLPAGAGYRIDALASTVTSLYRNTAGASFPYTSAFVSITGASDGLPDSYYFFYDWELTLDVSLCADERTPVQVEVTPSACLADVSLELEGPEAVVPGTEVELTLTVTNGGPEMAAGLMVDLPAPTGATFVANHGDCTAAFPCAFGDVPANTTLTITSTFAIDETFEGAASFNATVTTSSTNTSPGEGAATQETIVSEREPKPELQGFEAEEERVDRAVAPNRAADVLSVGGGGCGCSTPGQRPDGQAPFGLLIAGMGVAVLGRRRRR